LRVGIIPAAGAASRLGNVPKFFLPAPVDRSSLSLIESDQTNSLLRLHATMQSNFCDLVVVVTRPEWHDSIEKHLGEVSNVRIISFQSKTLGESILMGCMAGSTFVPSVSEYFLSLPDSAFEFSLIGEHLNSYMRPSCELQLFCWNTQPLSMGKFGEVQLNKDQTVTDHEDKPVNTKFSHFWGAMRFAPKFVASIRAHEDNLASAIQSSISRTTPSKPSVIGVEIKGDYYDVGTIQGYMALLSRGYVNDCTMSRGSGTIELD